MIHLLSKLFSTNKSYRCYASIALIFILISFTTHLFYEDDIFPCGNISLIMILSGHKFYFVLHVLYNPPRRRVVHG